MRVLVINAGSSSLKHAVVETESGELLSFAEERWEPEDVPGRHASELRSALGGDDRAPDAIGHRVAHGADVFAGPVLVDADVRAQIAALARLAPLHNQAALEGIDTAAEVWPGIPQVACFDTAFHHTLPAPAATYAVPHTWTERFGLRRYGFHGLNVEWCTQRAGELLSPAATRRLVVCHLGSGASVTAVLDGRSVDTTMGFTPLEGVPMATRSGSVDPGLLLHLAREGLSIDELDRGLNHQAGLLGVSRLSPDLRVVLRAAKAGDEHAQLAFDVLVRGVAAAIAAMSTALGGLDCLVFTAGAGEGSSALRATVAARIAHLGVELDDAENARAEPDADITAAGGRVRTLVIRAGEERVVAWETADTCRPAVSPDKRQ